MININYGVMLDNREIEEDIRKMSDVIRNTMYTLKETKPYYVIVEEDSVIGLLHEALCEYATYVVSGTNTSNLGLKHYLENYFDADINEALSNDVMLIKLLEALFIKAYAILQEKLNLAVNTINESGHVVDNIDRFTISQYNSFYVVNSLNPDAEINLGLLD